MPYNASMTTDSKVNHVNTDSLVMYGPDSVVKFSNYDLFLNVKMFRIKPEEQRTPKSMYDYSSRVSCNISMEDVLYLAYVLEKYAIPATNKLEPWFQGIKTGPNSMFAISNGIGENDSQEVKPYIAIYKGMNEKMIPVEMRFFRFRPRMVYTSYDYRTGEHTAAEDNRRGLYILSEFFKAMAGLVGPSAHLIRYFDRFKNNAQHTLITSIAGKLGVTNRPINTIGDAPNWNEDIQSDGGFDFGNDIVDITPTAKDGGQNDLAQLMSSSSLDDVKGLAS